MNAGSAILAVGGIAIWIWGMSAEPLTLVSGIAIFLGSALGTLGVGTCFLGLLKQ